MTAYGPNSSHAIGAMQRHKPTQEEEDRKKDARIKQTEEVFTHIRQPLTTGHWGGVEEGLVRAELGGGASSRLPGGLVIPIHQSFIHLTIQTASLTHSWTV